MRPDGGGYGVQQNGLQPLHPFAGTLTRLYRLSSARSSLVYTICVAKVSWLLQYRCTSLIQDLRKFGGKNKANSIVLETI